MAAAQQLIFPEMANLYDVIAFLREHFDELDEKQRKADDEYLSFRIKNTEKQEEFIPQHRDPFEDIDAMYCNHLMLDFRRENLTVGDDGKPLYWNCSWFGDCGHKTTQCYYDGCRRDLEGGGYTTGTVEPEDSNCAILVDGDLFCSIECYELDQLDRFIKTSLASALVELSGPYGQYEGAYTSDNVILCVFEYRCGYKKRDNVYNFLNPMVEAGFLDKIEMSAEARALIDFIVGR